MLCIVDYGLGNLGSIKNMLKKIGVASCISSSPDDIRAAEKLILPGVGAFDRGMENLKERSLIPVLEEQVLDRKVPMLGICLGMQLLCEGSEEGRLPGLGWIKASVKRFNAQDGLPVPHMGWCDVERVKRHPLVDALPPEPRFYFVHSYRVICENPEDELLRAVYGVPFTAAFASENILGVQFHPEKSHKFGMALLRNYVQDAQVLALA